jgi:hypothetical protein
MLQPTTFVRRANLSERQPGTFLSVSLEGVTALAAKFADFWAEIREFRTKREFFTVIRKFEDLLRRFELRIRG